MDTAVGEALMTGAVGELLIDWETNDLDPAEFHRRASELSDVERAELDRRRRLLAASNRILDLEKDFDSDSIPSRLDQYEIRRIVGRGGMGVVYEALDPDLQRSVALKVMASSAAISRRDDRLRQEAHVLAQLKHPNIVPIYAARFQKDCTYFAMEYVPHGTLAQHQRRIMEKGRRSVLELFLKIAAAVGEAHRRGILHRDLKPANILLTEADEPLVADFGLAKLSHALLPQDLPKALGEWTRQGQCPGTPPYMAPEQYDPSFGQVGPHTDVWALGVILYELVARRRLFQAESFADFRTQVCTHPIEPPGKAFAGRHGRRIWRILARCLERNPRDRYPDAAALAADVRTLLKPRPVALIVVSGLLAAVVLGVAARNFDYAEFKRGREFAALRDALTGDRSIDLNPSQTVRLARVRFGENAQITLGKVGVEVVAFQDAFVELMPDVSLKDGPITISATLRHLSQQSTDGEIGVYLEPYYGSKPRDETVDGFVGAFDDWNGRTDLHQKSASAAWLSFLRVTKVNSRGKSLNSSSTPYEVPFWPAGAERWQMPPRNISVTVGLEGVSMFFEEENSKVATKVEDAVPDWSKLAGWINKDGKPPAARFDGDRIPQRVSVGVFIRSGKVVVEKFQIECGNSNHLRRIP